MKRYVLYHAHCADGFGAALAAWLKFGDQAEYVPVSYGQPMPTIETRSEVYILDFSYRRDEILALENRSNHLVVLDHHATAEEELRGIPCCRFEPFKSGAVMAWEFFWPGQAVPMFYLYLQDRDLWTWNLPDSREVSAAVQSHPKEFKVWQTLAGLEPECRDLVGEDYAVDLLMEEGHTCLRVVQQQVESMAKQHEWALVRYDENAPKFVRLSKELRRAQRLAEAYKEQGDKQRLHIVPVVNATCFMSEVTNRLLELNPDAPFAAYYIDSAEARQWGLRSRPEFDCSAVAKAFGGGGHRCASGFRQNL